MKHNPCVKMSAFPTRAREDLMQLNRENQELQNDILQLQREFSSLDTGPSAAGSLQNDDASTKIWREKCKQMKAEIEVTDSAPLRMLPESEAVRFEVYTEDLQQRTRQLHECLQFVKMQQKEAAEEIEREQKTCTELETAVEIAERKLAESGRSKDSMTEVYKKFEVKLETMDQDNKQKVKKLNAFLDQHFPLPDKEAFNKVKKKFESSQEKKLTSVRDLKSLRSIIQNLMNKCLDSPNDPYITLDHTHWPPYIELLLQCDLAIRHHSDSSRLKLMPFHL